MHRSFLNPEPGKGREKQTASSGSAGVLLCAAFLVLALACARAEGLHISHEVTGAREAGADLIWVMTPLGGTGPYRVVAGVTMVYDNGSAEVLDAVGMRVEEGGQASLRIVPPHGGTLCLEAEWTDAEGASARTEAEYPIASSAGETWPVIGLSGPDRILTSEEAAYTFVPSLGTGPYTVHWDAVLTDAAGDSTCVSSGTLTSSGEAVRAGILCPRAGILDLEVRVTDAAGLKAYAALRAEAAEPQIRLEAERTVLSEGDTVRLYPSDASDPWHFETEDGAVLRVDDNGNVTAVGIGTAVVTAVRGTEEGRLTLTVRPKAEGLSVEGLILSPGEEGRLRPVLTPEGASGTFRYLSADESVASVGADGTVRAAGPGKAVIAVMDMDDPLLTVFTTVTVLEETDERARAYVFGLRYEDGAVSALYGAVGGGCSYTLRLCRDGQVISVRERDEAGMVRFYLADPADGDYVLTVTAVDQNGVISAASASGHLDRAAMTVSGESRMPVLITQILLSGPETAWPGQENVYTARVLPSGADGGIRWESSAPDVAQVDDSGVMTVLSAGWTTVSALAADGSGVRASMDVECTSDSLSLEEISLYRGESCPLSPVSGRGRVYDYHYEVSDARVLRVEMGIATALEEGKCTLTVTAAGTPLSLTVPVTVLPCRHLTGTWEQVSEPGCVTPGKRVMICDVCGAAAREEEVPAAGHDRGRWETRVPATPGSPGEKIRCCTRCGAVLETGAIRPISETTMNMNTACTEGITFRSMFPVKEWYMFTPVDLADGVQTLRLIASNMYQIGTVYVTVADGCVTVDYDLADDSLAFTDEFITFLPSLSDFAGTADLKAYRNYGFGIPWDIGEDLNGEERVMLFMCCRLNYSRDTRGLVVFSESQRHHLEYIEHLKRMTE